MNHHSAPRLRSVIVALAFATIPLSGAAAAVCGTGPNDTICMGTIDVPADQKAAFETAAKAAIDALSSPDLERDYKAFTSTHIVDGPQQEAWKTVEIDTALKNVREAIGGLSVTSYGGVGGWFKKVFAKDRVQQNAKAGTISFNRWALPQPVPSLAKTIVHTAALKAGLPEPSAIKSPSIAACEPPRVIAALVEKHLVGDGWKAGSDDCSTVGR